MHLRCTSHGDDSTQRLSQVTGHEEGHMLWSPAAGPSSTVIEGANDAVSVL